MFTRKPTFKIAYFILLTLLLFSFSVIVTRASEVAPPDDNETQDLESLEELLAADEEPDITLKVCQIHVTLCLSFFVLLGLFLWI